MTMVLGRVIDGEHVLHSLREAAEKLDGAGDDLILDFSRVSRLDPSALLALEKLATVAGEKAVKIVLRGVNVSVYRVLKLVKLTPRFSFLA